MSSSPPHVLSASVWGRFLLYVLFSGIVVLLALAGGDGDFGSGETKASWKTLGLCATVALAALGITFGVLADPASLGVWRSVLIAGGSVAATLASAFALRSIVTDLTPGARRR